jgi:hypothetical protein
MILEVGNSYQTADERVVPINFKSGTRVPLFRSEITGDAWFADGTHSSGNDSLRLIARVLGSAPAPAPTSAPVAAPGAVRLGSYEVRINLDAMTASVRRI